MSANIQLYEIELNSSQPLNGDDISSDKLFDSIGTLKPYCPISNKEKLNPPSINYIDIATNTSLFLNKKNIDHISDYIISLNIKQNTGYDLKHLRKNIPSIMEKWAKSVNLDDYEYIYENPITTLAYINHRFLVNNGNLFQKDITKNVFRMDGMTTDKNGNKVFKKYSEMTANEYKNINLWTQNDIFTNNDKYRYGNKIKEWEIGLYTRHYDRNNDGLQHSIPDRASLNTQVRGYDMSNIIKGSTFYDNYYYENI
jgi:hypothetical protein